MPHVTFGFISVIMPPKSKRQQHCEKICKNRIIQSTANQNKDTILHPQHFQGSLDSKTMVLNSYFNGTGYSKERFTALSSNMKPAAKSSYYRNQKAVNEAIHEIVKNDVDTYAQKIENGDCLVGDGCWNHPRNGTAHTTTIIDLNQNKVVGYSEVEKSKGSHCGNFNGASNMMESYGVKTTLEELTPYLKGKTITYVHDHDNKTSRIIGGMNELDFHESYDPVHATKELRRKINSYFNDCAEKRYSFKINAQKKDQKSQRVTKTAEKAHYDNVINKLIAWFQYLIYKIDDIDLRAKMWNNSCNHFIGDHKNCIHPSDFSSHGRGRPKKQKEQYWQWTDAINDSSYYEELSVFLEETTPLIIKVSSNASTQAVESLNSSIARTRPKNYNFSKSNQARAEVAIGMKNDHHFCTKLLSKINTDISVEALESMYKDEEIKHLSNLTKRETNEMKRKNDLRARERENYKSKPGDYQKKYPSS